MKTVICDACKGKKVMLYLGGLLKECKRCNGIGHVESDVTEETETEKEIEKIKTEKSTYTGKKRGRKPKQLAEGSNGLQRMDTNP